MAILTIARELGAISEGEELKLCEQLQLRCISRETLRRRFAEQGISKESFARFDECKPGITAVFNAEAAQYSQVLHQIVMEELLNDNIAFIGRGGNFLLEGYNACLRLRLISPLEQRIARIAAERSCSDKEAEKLIQQSDREKEEFCRHYYDKSWSDPANYDLVVNTTEIPLDDIAELLPRLMAAKGSDEDLKQLKLRLREQIIKHELFAVKSLTWSYREVLCPEDGVLVLRGNVTSSAAAEFLEEMAKNMPGIHTVRNELKTVLKDIPFRGR